MIASDDLDPLWDDDSDAGGEQVTLVGRFSGRALLARMFWMVVRGQDPKTTRNQREFIRQLVSVYTESDLDALHDAGHEPLPQLPPERDRVHLNDERRGPSIAWLTCLTAGHGPAQSTS